MDYRNYQSAYFDYLEHHGIKGMHWGIRRYQNPDGTLTAKGRKRYAKDLNRLDEKASQYAADAEVYKKRGDEYKKAAEDYKKVSDPNKNTVEKEIRKNEALANSMYKKSEEHASKAKEYESEQWKGISDALSRGADVSTKRVYRHDQRSVSEGVKAALAGTGVSLALSPLAGAATGVVLSENFYNESWGKYRQTPHKIEGNQFILSPAKGDKGSMNIIIDLSKVDDKMKQIKSNK